MEPRPAATLILTRPAHPGVEVLALTRAASSRFAPGFTVFPGGTVDAGDAVLAEHLFGERDQAARACAVRELLEETSILLTASGPRPAGGSSEELTLDPPRARDLPEIARWIAPEFLEVRFDARFFAAAAPRGVEPSPDGREIAEAAWRRPAELLVSAEAGDATLMWPTLVMLRALDGCGGVEDVLDLHVEQVMRPDGPNRPLAATPPEATG